jgi:hypothetical protein
LPTCISKKSLVADFGANYSRAMSRFNGVSNENRVQGGSPAAVVATGKRSKALQGSVPVPAHGLARRWGHPALRMLGGGHRNIQHTVRYTELSPSYEKTLG